MTICVFEITGNLLPLPLRGMLRWLRSIKIEFILHTEFWTKPDFCCLKEQHTIRQNGRKVIDYLLVLRMCYNQNCAQEN